MTGEKLLSVGLDVGTTTTQMILSELTVENQAGAFSVPKMEIVGRRILYRSKVHFTPLVGKDLVDGDALRRLVEEDYRLAGVLREQVDTGAIIITGETSRKENAAQVLSALSHLAGDFVVATAGPDLESILAAKGAGATEYSLNRNQPVLHIDIGGGTSNLALLEKGKILRTGCLNVGGRLMTFAPDGKIQYLSPVLEGLTSLRTGDVPTPQQRETVAQLLTRVLEMAAGLRPPTELLDQLMTKEAKVSWQIPEKPCLLSFSGGVAACIEKVYPPLAFGDLGAILGQEIRNSLLCRGEYALGQDAIRATVIGAGCHSTRLSGSTVFYRNVKLPLKNLPVACFSYEEQMSEEFPRLIANRLTEKDEETAVLAFPGLTDASYGQISRLADAVIAGTAGKNIFVCLQADMAKALGQTIALRTEKDRPCLCIDSVALSSESYLDIGAAVGPCLPVVIKTIVLQGGSQKN